jgi:hypothetical protein
MFSTPRRYYFVAILIGLTLLAAVPNQPRAAVASGPAVAAAGALHGLRVSFAPAAPRAPTACPSAPSSLPDIVERTNFCVYYDNDTTHTNFVTDTQAGNAADIVQAYWDAYVGFGFNAPAFTSKLEVQLTKDAGCNGGTSSTTNVMDAFTGCFGVNNDIRSVLGHELFHRIQYSYDGTEVKWFKEGTARAIQDNVFADLDGWAGALGQSFSFNSEANNYLAATNNDITSIPMRYQSSLWWKYFSEQFGTVTTEPQRGVDAFIQLWQSAASANDLAALNNALANLSPGTDFNRAFRRFAVANITKDLTGVPDASYNYIDEEQAGNPAVYGPLMPANGGVINLATSAVFNNQAVTRYGVSYFAATPAAACVVVTVSFHRDSGADVFYHVVTQKGTALARTVEGSGADWTQSFLNDGLTRVVAIVGGQANAGQADVTFSCANPVIDIRQPNSGAVAHVGPAAGPGKFLAQVLVTNGSPTAPVVGGLTNSDFKAKVNGVNALVTGGGFIQEQYWLLISAPTQSANGTYDLEITLEAPGAATAIATDTNTASVAYDNDSTDQVLVIDRSGSMVDDNKMAAARDAANLYVDIARTNDGLAVVPFNHDLNPAPFTMQVVNPTVRTNAHTYINGLTASGATSIGDGLQGAVTQRTGSPTGNPRCSIVLLSDGMENSAAFYSSVKAAVQGTSCPVTAVAFGSQADETLMQTIATDTGGLFFYNDVYVSAFSADGAGLSPAAAADNTELDLGSTYEYAEAMAEGRQRLLLDSGVLQNQAIEHVVPIDGSISEAVFTLDWTDFIFLRLRLRKPDGNLYTGPYSFYDVNSGHAGYRVPNPAVGNWTMIVDYEPGPGLVQPAGEANYPYQVMASAQTDLVVLLITPDRFGGQFFTGNQVPIYAVLASPNPLPGFQIWAHITAPNGLLTILPLYDDGQHDDGVAGDAFYGNTYTLVNQALAVMPTGSGEPEPPIPPRDEGSYRVNLVGLGTGLRREALGSFAVLEGADTNTNGLPDPFEDTHHVSEPGGDPDLDQLSNLDEYFSGTDPNNSDSDGGGENDGSEVNFGQDPLDPSDDQIEAPEFLVTTPGNGEVGLYYDVKAEYDSMVLYRATSPTGPWAVQVPELPLSGIYSDTATNGNTYFYKLEGVDAGAHRTAIIDAGDASTASSDPIAPEARVLVNGDAPETTSLSVVLNFAPYDLEGLSQAETFDDITEMKLSNAPSLAGANWQPFAQAVPWTLVLPSPGTAAQVYAQFRDAAGNASPISVGSILFSGHAILLPITMHP